VTLADQNCIPCRGGVPPLTPAQIAPLARQVPDWQVIENHHIRREFKFPDFKTALAFVDAIGAEAEAQGHHPDLELAWGRVGVTLYTHKIDGLAEADFVMAARIDRLHARGHEAGARTR
jgi:4a-hydroxytetrahydrobiopterin dehydratase